MNDCVFALSEPGATPASRPAGPARRGRAPSPAPTGLPPPTIPPPLPARKRPRIAAGGWVDFSLCYRFQMTNSGAVWNIWKTQIKRKGKEEKELE